MPYMPNEITEKIPRRIPLLGERRADGSPADRDRDVALWRSVGRRALNAGDAELALAAWKRVRELEPDADDAMFHLAHALLLQGQAQRACLIFDALASSPRAPHALREEARRMVAAYEPAA